MALRNASRLWFKNWFGLNTFDDEENLTPQWWRDASNVLVSAHGTAEVLRSPSGFNPALATTNRILSLTEFKRNAGHRLVFDINASSGSNVATYVVASDGSSNTSVRTGQSDAPWISETINDCLYRLNGSEFIQLLNDLSTVVKVGITGPASAPTISYVAGGSGSIATGINVSYAYRNSTTGHISAPSPVSNSLTASTNPTLRTAVTASAQAGVDGIVLFATLDGGSIRYLIVDSNGDPQVFSNATGNIDVQIANLHWDTLTPETSYNGIPPINAGFMFKWRDRLFLTGFTGATTRQQIQYSGFENVYYGQPWESWPSLNIINIPNKGEAAIGGIATQYGALILSDQDAYLLSGYPSDKTAGPEGSVSITEHLEPLSWHIGTKSPKTLQNSPFGTIWLDQDKRLQIWTGDGFPKEMALPIRDQLSDIDGSMLSSAEGRWFQHGKNGGFYVLTASTNGTNNDKLFFVTVYKDPQTNEQRWGFGISDISAQCLATALVSNLERFFFGGTDQVFGILDPDLAGDGWDSGQSRYFEVPIGNDDNFSYFHSIRLDGDITGLTLTIANPDGTDSQDVTLENALDTGSSYFGLLDTYGHRKILRFEYDNTDTALREVRNLQIYYGNKPRNL